jgi:hypothetical protein
MLYSKWSQCGGLCYGVGGYPGSLLGISVEHNANRNFSDDSSDQIKFGDMGCTNVLSVFCWDTYLADIVHSSLQCAYSIVQS